jgi:glucose dehydrogenase
MNAVTRATLPLFVLLASLQLHAQVSYDRMLHAASEPRNWLIYSGSYASQRYSRLDQVTPANVTRLEHKWTLQNQVFGAWQSNPLVVDGIMYVTQRQNDVLALDANRPRLLVVPYTPSPDARVCCGSNNRGVAILGDTCMGTSTGMSSRSTRSAAARSGTSRWPTSSSRTRSRWRRSS